MILRRARPITVVLDNARYQRCALVQSLARSLRIELLFLPSYSPNLNLIERVWRYLKQKLACHRFWNDVAGLEAAATRLLDQLVAHFHAAEGPSIFLRQDFCEAA